MMNRRAERKTTRAWSGTVLNSILTLGAVFVAAMPVFGHKHPCVHSHARGNPKFVITCVPRNGAACTTPGGATGTCKSIQGRTKVSCNCVPNDKPSGGCMALSLYFFSHQGEGAPTAGNGIIYLALSDPRNYVSINLGALTLPEFGPEENGMEGTISLVFGSFEDPTEVPVTIEDISMSAPSVFLSGTNFLELPGGFSQNLVYNSVTGIIDTLDSTGIELAVTNDHGTEIVPAYFNAERKDGGFLMEVQLYAENPLFADGFESGDVSRWSSLGAAALDFIDILRGRMGWQRTTRVASSQEPVEQCREPPASLQN